MGRNQRWELNVALCAGCFDSGASVGLLDWMTRLNCSAPNVFLLCAPFHTKALRVCLLSSLGSAWGFEQSMVGSWEWWATASQSDFSPKVSESQGVVVPVG